MMIELNTFQLYAYLPALSATLLILVTFIFYRLNSHSYWSSRGVPGPKPNIIFGNSLELVSRPLLQYDIEITSKYGKLIGLYNGGSPVLMTWDPDLVKEMTVKKFYAFTDRRDYNGNEHLINSLLASDGVRWRRLRKLMSPAFSSGKIRAMNKLMLEPIEHAVDRLRNSNEHVNIQDVVRRMTLEAIARTAFGIELKNKDETEVVLENGNKVLETTTTRMFLGTVLPLMVKKWLDFTIFNKESIEYFAKIVEAIMEQRKKHPELQREFPDFVDLMLEASDENNDTLTPKEVTANCVITLLAGLDTTSNVITSTLFALAHHQEAQTKLRKEIMNVDCCMANELQSNNQSLQYLDAVIDEASRLCPPVSRTERIAVEDVTLDNGLTLDKGTVVIFSIYALHHSSEYWSEPAKFIPERFLPENRDKVNQYAFMPFHLGPRNCVGKRFALVEARSAIFQIIKNFKLLPSIKSQYPLTFPKAANLLTISEPVYIRVEKL